MRLLNTPNETYTSILLGNTFVNIGAALCAGVMAERLIKFSPFISFLIGAILITGVILIFGEIIPKLLAISKSESFALSAAMPLLLWHLLVTPIRWVIHLLTDSILKMMDVRPDSDATTMNEEELKILLSTSEIADVLPEDEQEMIEGVLELGDTTGEDVMTPRIEVEAYPVDIRRDELIESIQNSPHSRVPIYREQIDDVVGILHVKDILLNPDKPLMTLLRNPLTFTPNQPLISMLAAFKRYRAHMSVVVDEYGGTVGIVTLQDVLEEIIRGLEERYEKEINKINKINDKEYIIAGNMEIRNINEELLLELPEEDARTIAGLMINLMERIPDQGEELIANNVKLIVEQRAKRRITKIRIIILPRETESKAEGNNGVTK
jgi:CBS domain containing-hemolysin-like protein